MIPFVLPQIGAFPMISRVLSLLTLVALVGHAVFGCCLPHAHADEREPAPVLGAESAGACHEHDDPCHRGTHHTHLEGDSCTYLLPSKAELPAGDSAGRWDVMAAEFALPARITDVFSAAQSPDLSPSGLPPTRTVRDITQVHLL